MVYASFRRRSAPHSTRSGAASTDSWCRSTQRLPSSSDTAPHGRCCASTSRRRCRTSYHRSKLPVEPGCEGLGPSSMARRSPASVADIRPQRHQRLPVSAPEPTKPRTVRDRGVLPPKTSLVGLRLGSAWPPYRRSLSPGRNRGGRAGSPTAALLKKRPFDRLVCGARRRNSAHLTWPCREAPGTTAANPRLRRIIDRGSAREPLEQLAENQRDDGCSTSEHVKSVHRSPLGRRI